jgi:hypothetical protein
MNIPMMLGGFAIVIVFTVLVVRRSKPLPPTLQIQPLETPLTLEFSISARDQFEQSQVKRWVEYGATITFLILAWLLRDTMIQQLTNYPIAFEFILLALFAIFRLLVTEAARWLFVRQQTNLSQRFSLYFTASDPNALERLDEPQVLRFELLQRFILIVLWNKQRVIVPRDLFNDAFPEAAFLALLQHAPTLEIGKYIRIFSCSQVETITHLE